MVRVSPRRATRVGDRPGRFGVPPHRFGRSWLTDERGRALDVVPVRLPPKLFRRWLADETRKAAEASLLGRAYPATGWAPLAEAWDETALDALPGDAPDPLLLLVRREEGKRLRPRQFARSASDH